jgi:hypothetical protein
MTRRRRLYYGERAAAADSFGHGGEMDEFRRRNALRRATFDVTILGMLLWAGSAAAQEAIGGAKLAENDVRGETARGTSPVHVGDQVFQNEWVRTGTDSLAQIALRDETNVSLGPSSQIKLDRFVYEGSGSTATKVVFNATKGAFRFFSGNSASAAYQVTTPQATIGVRGTIYDVLIESNGTRVVLQEGVAHICLRNSSRCRDLTEPGSSIFVGLKNITGPFTPGETPWHFADLCRQNSQLCERTTIAGLDLAPPTRIAGNSGGEAPPPPPPPPQDFTLPLISGAALVFFGVLVSEHHHHLCVLSNVQNDNEDENDPTPPDCVSPSQVSP